MKIFRYCSIKSEQMRLPGVSSRMTMLFTRLGMTEKLFVDRSAFAELNTHSPSRSVTDFTDRRSDLRAEAEAEAAAEAATTLLGSTSGTTALFLSAAATVAAKMFYTMI
uniref:Uncharacterized protein n=1 Tax=Glossina pallidipes TaxID=7398 RepID=A0A1A9ZCP8_GLOPL